MNNLRPLVLRTLPLDAKVLELIDEDGAKWRRNLISHIFLPFKASAISKLPLSRRLPDDVLFWRSSKNGMCTVKSGYYIAHQSCFQSNASSFSLHGFDMI